MIYIDPPYNTANGDFVYNDTRTYKLDDLINAGMSEDEAKRVLEFSTKKSSSHSAWLTFMYPRLFLARKLLKDDGVIFISIDDNEAAQLKLLCDEIFGEENFITNLHVELSATQGMKVAAAQQGQIVKNGEYVLVYSKNIEHFNFEKSLYISKSWDTHYSIYLDKNTLERKTLLEVLQIQYPNLKAKDISKFYDIDEDFRNYIHKNSENIFRDAMCETNFDFSEQEKNDLDNFKVIFHKSYFLFKTTTGVIRQLLPLDKAIGNTDDFGGSFGLRKIRGDWWGGYYKDMMNINKEGGIIFKNGKKPIRLIRDILKISTDKDDIVLDFFAGSGTTGHAVMQLNAEDGGNRKFILVQLDEKIDEKKNKIAYDFVKDELKREPTIYEITRERLLRAAKKIKHDYANATNLEFSEFSIVPKDELELEKLEKLDLSLSDDLFINFDESKTNEILTSYKLADGIALDVEFKTVFLNEYKAYYSNKLLYLVYPYFTSENTKALMQKLQNKDLICERVILYNASFKSSEHKTLKDALNQIGVKLQVRF